MSQETKDDWQLGVVQPEGREGSKETLEHIIVCKESLQERCKETFDKGM